MCPRQRTNEKPATANNAFKCAKMAWVAGVGEAEIEREHRAAPPESDLTTAIARQQMETLQSPR